MGAGDDTFVWNPGDDNDTVEGQYGYDTLDFNGANIAREDRHLGERRACGFTRDVANVDMDLNGVEAIDFNALGGADTVRPRPLGHRRDEVSINLRRHRRPVATVRPIRS